MAPGALGDRKHVLRVRALMLGRGIDLARHLLKQPKWHQRRAAGQECTFLVRCVGRVVVSIQRNTPSLAPLNAIPLRKLSMSGAIEPTSHTGGWPGKLVGPCERILPDRR